MYTTCFYHFNCLRFVNLIFITKPAVNFLDFIKIWEFSSLYIPTLKNFKSRIKFGYVILRCDPHRATMTHTNPHPPIKSSHPPHPKKVYTDPYRPLKSAHQPTPTHKKFIPANTNTLTYKCLIKFNNTDDSWTSDNHAELKFGVRLSH